MAKLYVRDLTPNTQVELEPFVVRDKSLSPFKNKPGKFLTVTLLDCTGEVKARVWDHAEEIAAGFEPGDVVTVSGRAEEYQGQKQLVLSVIRPAEEGSYDPEDLRPGGQRPLAELLQWLDEVLGLVESPPLAALLAGFFGDQAFRERFAAAFGARGIHHSYPGGLLEHTLSVVQILLCVADLHPELDRDLLIVGGLLHDVGKLEELAGSLVADYTDEGRLLGHTVLTDRMVNAKIAEIPGFSTRLAELLSHMLLSHHGEREYGAPVVPMTLEACALHHADIMDARVQGFKQVRQNADGAAGNWSEYNRTYQRAIYLGEVPGLAGPEPGEPGEPPLNGQLPL
jgi:3'-5' exoribonuclease